MSRSTLLDPAAGALGGVAAIGSFFLIPGLAAAIPAAIGIGALVYAGKVAVSAMRGDDKPSAVAPEGPRPKRGSPAEVWSGRADKALWTMRELVASCDQPIIQGQLENVALQAGDARGVIAELAAQSAALDQAIDRSAGQDAAVARLTAQRTGLTERMEKTVRGLEALNAEMSEIIAIAKTAGAVGDWGGEQRVAELRDDLVGLRSGLEESQRYSNDVLRSQQQ